MRQGQEPEEVAYDERFLEASWHWLNDPETASLIMSGPMTRDSQRAWFESLPARTDYVLWGVAVADIPIGAFGLKNVESSEAEYWGFIGDGAFRGRGIGRWMLSRAIAHARSRGLSRLYLNVRIDNIRALALYRSTGFVETSRTDDRVCMEIAL